MPDQLEFNQPFEERTQEIKNEIKSLLIRLGNNESEIMDIYQDLNWGSLANNVLYTALLAMDRNNELMSADQILSTRNRTPNKPSGRPTTQEEPAEQSETWVRRRQPVITKDIKWFINNGSSAEIRNKAQDYRQKVLLTLYTEHVRETGETYFPELHGLLKAEWDFSYSNEDD